MATTTPPAGFEGEVARGERFEFGKNWSDFLAVVDEQRIGEAESSLREMLGVDDLTGRTFLDVGSGSGLFSLAAARLGAARVRSFDYDPSSVACTNELRRRFGPPAADWSAEHGSALDAPYLRSLGRFDVVYAWGVLHHTGDMWAAIANVTEAVADGGRLFISIYNDQGLRSRLWRAIKRAYNALRSARDGAARGAQRRRLDGPRAPARLRPQLGRPARARHEPLARPRRLGRRLSVRGRHARAGLRLRAGARLRARPAQDLRRGHRV
jgi:SAM-dependent methyltransferase